MLMLIPAAPPRLFFSFTFLLFLANLSEFIANVSAQEDCMEAREFHTAFICYMNCVNHNTSEYSQSLSLEMRQHTREAIKKCFISTSKHKVASDGFCVMDASELDGKAWGRNGPLKNCKLCRTFADAIVTATLYTPPEEAKCFLGEIVQAVIREGNDCIMEKNPDFPGLPASPIIEKPMHKDIEDLIDDISNFIIVHSRIQKCANEDPEAANTTTKCIEKPFPGFLEKHKNLLRDCVQAIPNKCRKKLNVLKDAICWCVQDARAEVRRRFERLTQSFHLAVQSRVDREKAIGKGGQIESCVEKIRSFMKTNANDWYEVVDSATSKCLKSNPMRRSVGIKPLLHVGCKKILHDKTGIYMKQLSEAFDFVGYLIDAITNRSSRICNIDQ